MVTGFLTRDYSSLDFNFATYIQLVLSFGMSGAILLLPYCLHGVKDTFIFTVTHLLPSLHIV